MPQVDIVVQRNVAERWSDIEHEVDRVVARACHGEFTTADIKRLIEKGYAFAGYVHDGTDVKLVVVWEMVHYPAFTAVNVCCLGGRDLAGSWAQFGEVAKEVWRAQGATAVECSVSPAMAKVLQRAGFEAEPVYTIMRGEI